MFQRPGFRFSGRFSRLRWHHLYFALAAFDLLTISGSLWLSHRITELYAQSVTENREWGHRLAHYAELSQRAGDVNAPGNDVFDSQDSDVQRERMRTAYEAFNTGVGQARTELMAANDPSVTARLLDGVGEIEAAMAGMVEEAELIFGFFDRGEAKQAGERMATMDRKYAEVITGFARLNAAVREIQERMFAAQGDAVEDLRRHERVIAAFILIMIGGVTLYGHKLAQAMRRSDQERAERTHELETAHAMAEAASRAKSNFLSNMSHEIRTPMNGVLGMLDLLKGSGLTPAQLRNAEIAHQSAASLLAIINDILDLSRIESGRFELELQPFDLPSSMEMVVEVLAREAFRKNIDLHLRIDGQVPARVVGDATRLRQVLLNLIGNGIKFTETGEVVVSLTIDANPGFLRVEVMDTGVGIAPDVIDTLFQPFAQADSSIRRRYGGTGLGLSICRELVTRMGGTIDLTSQPGSGTTVTLRLPREAAGTDTAAGTAMVLRGRHVMVMVGSPTVRAIAAAYLVEAGASVGVVEPGVEREDANGAVWLIDDQAAARVAPDLVARGAAVVVLTEDTATVDRISVAAPHRLTSLHRPLMRGDLLHAMNRVLSPAGTPGRVTPPPPREPASPTVALRVLLAEDNPTNVLVASRYLKKLGCTVVHAANGALAMEALKGDPFDLVLMDCQMPELDGLSATRGIRAWERERGRARIPIIAVTANAFADDREACLAAGMDDHISKPFTMAQLSAAIRRWGGQGHDPGGNAPMLEVQ